MQAILIKLTETTILVSEHIGIQHLHQLDSIESLSLSRAGRKPPPNHIHRSTFLQRTFFKDGL